MLVSPGSSDLLAATSILCARMVRIVMLLPLVVEALPSLVATMVVVVNAAAVAADDDGEDSTCFGLDVVEVVLMHVLY